MTHHDKALDHTRQALANLAHGNIEAAQVQLEKALQAVKGPHKKIYLSGPMTGIADFNKPEFARITAELRKAGHLIVNPAELDFGDTGILEWHEYLRRDLAAMISDCNSICVLDGWHNSRGAVLELAVASVLGWPIYTVEDLLPDGTIGGRSVEKLQIFSAAFRLFACEKESAKCSE